MLHDLKGRSTQRIARELPGLRRTVSCGNLRTDPLCPMGLSPPFPPISFLSFQGLRATKLTAAFHRSGEYPGRKAHEKPQETRQANDEGKSDTNLYPEIIDVPMEDVWDDGGDLYNTDGDDGFSKQVS